MALLVRIIDRKGKASELAVCDSEQTVTKNYKEYVSSTETVDSTIIYFFIALLVRIIMKIP